MGQLFIAMPDKRTHKFVLRLLLKVNTVDGNMLVVVVVNLHLPLFQNPDTESLLLICGHNSLNASSYKLALGQRHHQCLHQCL